MLNMTNLLEPGHSHGHPGHPGLAEAPSAEAVDQLADLFHLLGDPTRLRIVLACLAQPTAVGDIAGLLALSSSLVSHHLRLLRAARIVKAERQGKQVFYSAADAHISGLLTNMFEHIAEPANGIDP